MAFTLAGCLAGYIIIALLFRKFFHINLGWGYGMLVFITGWIIATIPGWIAGGADAYEYGFIIIWPILTYGILFFSVRIILKQQQTGSETE